MAKILCVLVLAISCASAIWLQGENNRITAGNIATDSQFPYTISIQQISYLPSQIQAHRCGGAMITFQHALTTATCTYAYNENGTAVPIVASQYRVYAGGALLTGDSIVERIRNIANFTVHPNHLGFPALLNDIAIVTLVSPYQNTTVVPIPLATADYAPNDFTLCSLAGWGSTTANTAAASNQLTYATKYTYSQSLCTHLYNTAPGTTNIHPSMICAVSYDIFSVGCYGDEGNALVCDGQLTGILSLTNRCVMTSYPEVYTRVSNYTTWIRSVTGSASTFKPELGVLALVAVVCMKLFS